MTPSVVNKTLAALGHARQADSFQSGREAAQMAKGQLPSKSSPDLVLVFGPDNVHFKNLIEGVRLVTGGDVLIGIPTRRVIANEVYSPEACIVLMLQSIEHHITLASTPLTAENRPASVSSLFTQLREKRGNIRKQFSENGLIIFDNTAKVFTAETTKMIAAETGLDSWVLSASPRIDQRTAMMCGDMALTDGVIVAECLSNNRWGMGEVHLGEFKNMNGIYQQAICAALRAALSEMGEGVPAFGLVLFNFPVDDISTMELKNIFVAARSVVNEIPLICFSTEWQYIQDAEQSKSLEGDWMTVLLIPQ